MVGQLVRDGHRHSGLFNLDFWFMCQCRASIPLRGDARTSKSLRSFAMESALDALDAGHPINRFGHNSFLIMAISASKVGSALRSRIVHYVEKWLDEGVFHPINHTTGSNQEEENNNLTLRALSVCAQMDSLPLLKKMCELIDFTQMSDKMSNSTSYPVVSRTVCFPEQLPLLKFLLEETEKKKIIWPNAEDHLPYLLQSAVGFLNREAVNFLIKEKGVSIDQSFFPDRNQESWPGILTESIESVVHPVFLPREEFLPDLIELLQDLIDFGAPIEPPMGKNSLLIQALLSKENMRSYAFVRWMLDQGSNPNNMGEINKPPLWLAVQHQLYDIIDLLIERGADINFTKSGDLSLEEQGVLGIAAIQDDVPLFTHLLNKGATISALQKEQFMREAGPSVAAFIQNEYLKEQTAPTGSSRRSLRL